MLNSPAPNASLISEDGSQIPLSGNCSLGRSSENLVVIRSEKVSRRHAIIHAQDGEYWVIDLGSVNGTFLNQRRVQQPARLSSGDTLTVAGYTFQFRQTEAQPDCDDSLGGSSVATMAEIRNENCWLLLADIENFTVLSQRMPPEELAILVGQWVRHSREAIEKAGGEINKYLGDGYMAFWIDGQGIVERVASAIGTLRILQANNSPEFRVVVHYGRVAMGGAAAKGEESLMGPEVNFAFRLEKLAGGLKITAALSEAAYERLGDLVPTSPVEGRHSLKGFEGTYRIYAIA